ncbi:MAG: hypothetical protein UX04_C0003G0087 [Microgenomates group bacterium GW2011_GWF2_45_18]|nr:MAG: hypothetical protein UW18_C0002G0087 [Microgenomates group bacterium GW2011_GWF1_44_10]KKU01815.1 MAG: hypothetical protein UX04_C0003G0087 [Microgenomates group bacterium GW2011_GWF2_45_18]OGJ41448.1 MAG: hypothetical protein A2378_02605 [Candidatus Pacebacteria bacterium RIFOXYB1_FULL_44_10]HAU98881.1 hypothetical protein [Candidatus Paceibacterota bacterium]HAX01161.1 hypothetical protein [Candidatus Paceibacterota bacterium]
MIDMQEDALSLKKAVGATLFMIFVVGTSFYGAYLYNQHRKQQVIAKYESELQDHVSRYPEKWKELFTRTMDACLYMAQQECAKDECSYYPSQKCLYATQQLSDLHVDQLKDSSSTMYMRVQNDMVDTLTASGDYQEPQALSSSSYVSFSRYSNERSPMYDYFLSQDKKSIWEDVTYHLTGKEVVIPVVIDDQLYGYVLRSVLER